MVVTRAQAKANPTMAAGVEDTFKAARAPKVKAPKVESIATKMFAKLSNFFAAFKESLYLGCSKIKLETQSLASGAKSLAGRVSASIVENATAGYNKVRGIFVRAA